jgi:hypothetical protein
MLRIPHCLDNRVTDGGKVVSPTHPPHFTPLKHFYFYVEINIKINHGEVLCEVGKNFEQFKMRDIYSLFKTFLKLRVPQVAVNH